MLQITMNNCQASVINGPNGLKFLQLVDPESHIVVLAPFTQDAARSIGAALSTGLIVANGPLKTTEPVAQ